MPLAGLLVLLLPSVQAGVGATNTFLFTYADRAALLADGWSYTGQVPLNPGGDVPRNTETTNGAVVSYDQQQHPGILRIPVDAGDIWAAINTTRNSLFRSLPPAWVSVKLALTFWPTQNTQQANLAIYQDDDNYVTIAHAFNAVEKIAMVQETAAYPVVLNTLPVTATNVWLRLDRNLDTGIVTGLYSLDDTNWTVVSQSWQTLRNPKLGIITGGSQGGFPCADIARVDVTTSDSPPPPVMKAQPDHLVFGSVAGRAGSNMQQVRLVVRAQDSDVPWSVWNSSAWLTCSPTNGTTPGICELSVSAAGLSPGIYEDVVQFSGLAGTGALTRVTLVVNPDCSASVSAWRGAKAAAMSVSTDDSRPSGYTSLITNGFAGTYYLQGPAPPAFATTYYQTGMELGSHTVTHPCYVVNDAAMRWEFTNNCAGIVAGTPETTNELISFAWPCGDVDLREQVIASDYFLSARGYNLNQLELPTPVNFMNLKSFNSHEHQPYPPSDLKTLVDAAIAQKKWFNLVLHDFNNDDGATAYAVGKDIWVTPIGTVVKYIVQRDRTIITNYLETPDQIQFDCYRLPVDPSPLRSFENAFKAEDKLTFQVRLPVTDIISGVTVDGAPVLFAEKKLGPDRFAIVDLAVTNALRRVVVELGVDLRIQLVKVEADAAILAWNSISNKTYRVQYNDGEGAWLDIAPDITAVGPTSSVTNSLGTATQRFYRVVQLP